MDKEKIPDRMLESLPGIPYELETRCVYLLATTQDQSKSTESEKGCGGWLWDSG